jgi:hypothetical protein
MDAGLELREPGLKILLILLPSHPIDPRGGLPLKSVEAVPKKRFRDMVK